MDILIGSKAPAAYKYLHLYLKIPTPISRSRPMMSMKGEYMRFSLFCTTGTDPFVVSKRDTAPRSHPRGHQIKSTRNNPPRLFPYRKFRSRRSATRLPVRTQNHLLPSKEDMLSKFTETKPCRSTRTRTHPPVAAAPPSAAAVTVIALNALGRPCLAQMAGRLLVPC